MSRTEIYLSVFGFGVTLASFVLLALHMILWALSVAMAGGAAILIAHGLAGTAPRRQPAGTGTAAPRRT